jgi:hypothetical protein
MNDRFELKITRSGTRISIVSDNTAHMCGAATVRNTNRIDITGTGASGDVIGSTIVELDLGSGPWGLEQVMSRLEQARSRSGSR